MQKRVRVSARMSVGVEVSVRESEGECKGGSECKGE